MSELLNQRSLKGARQLLRFRLTLIGLSAVCICCGVAAVLLPAIAAVLSGVGNSSVRVVRVAYWVGVATWGYSMPRFIANCLKSMGRFDDLAPALSRVIQKVARNVWGVWLAIISVACAVGAAVEIALGLRILPLFAAENPLEWGVFWMAAAIVSGALVPVLEYLQDLSARTALEKLATASTPQYEHVAGDRDDAALYHLYRFKNAAATRERGFRIPNVPVYFVVPPNESGFTIELSADPGEKSKPSSVERAVSEAAARRGLDWSGFTRWRRRQEEDRYLWSHEWDDGFMVTAIENRGSTIAIAGTQAPYSEFLIRDKSADLYVEGVLVRDILEEPTWNHEFDLSVLQRSRGYYSYCLGVNALYCTRDGFLVLQRRSTGLQTGGGNLGASVAGSLQWKDVVRAGARAVRTSDAALIGIRRETREELGIADHEVEFDDAPCTGLGLNLRHGRDPNLYFWGQLKLCHAELSDRKKASFRDRELGRDAWEWDHLVFAPIGMVGSDGSIAGPVGSLLAGARHLKAALLALAQNRRFQQLQQESRPVSTASTR